jgi:predicted enzyme involved in methoxymalonyl-ACP biosynthesis
MSEIIYKKIEPLAQITIKWNGKEETICSVGEQSNITKKDLMFMTENLIEMMQGEENMEARKDV